VRGVRESPLVREHDRRRQRAAVSNLLVLGPEHAMGEAMTKPSKDAAVNAQQPRRRVGEPDWEEMAASWIDLHPQGSKGELALLLKLAHGLGHIQGRLDELAAQRQPLGVLYDDGN